MTLATALLILALIVIGASAQRVAGLGFALLVAPFMTLVLGAHSGVVIVNLCGVISSLLILPRVWRLIDWSQFRWLGASAVLGSVLGSWIAVGASPAVLSVSVGAIVILALASSLLLSGRAFSRERLAPRVVTGVTAGLTNSLAGVGGPPVSAYALLTNWSPAAFAATLQPFFVLIGSMSAGTKLLMDPSVMPAVPAWAWLAVVAAILVGIAIGERLLKLVTPAQVRTVVIVIAFAGALATLIRGLVELLG
ncbi:sulfite exporter TauE/SafE family protein [Leucobacter sp. M11]|uniref:sulfite exporter TauE/SafE family protein n=1 Tax=Leucobacter sp. M11 TaxID=2993565 RepID=UPI002D7E311E|nr:sulfite exporter TauE/SafE family protein [Leucobacter sp. M11]MEB4615734.1 sulfite exporter TauE/SafE family protein [Leucobacter sp. M11]